ncbi:SDR family oxidoreductase [Flagellimonas algicola]|uniref:SDR family oxidoreductase n=1 Tax=Flagellimonas algicola TaxID=2583815 RepID=A0ABY2WFV4_9FLAO|nr:SDR family oxidoreductase [Allomuricauda algicola]TMU50402.1 SDR family oxidoreductase [Allomuricauda algicola]
MSEIDGKVVAITGASSGLGEATARYLAAKGAKIVLGARREEKLEIIASDINKNGGSAIHLKMDVTNRAEVKALADMAVREFGRLDVFVNNAGLMAIAPLQALKVDEWDRMIDINIKGVLYGIAAALPVFEDQESGHFINISSVAGLKVFSPGGTVYSGTKYAVRAISDGLRHEVGKKIRTTTLEPGAIASELQSGTSHKESVDILNEFYKIAIPAETVAKAIAFAIEQPMDVDINEIALRPTIQDF